MGERPSRGEATGEKLSLCPEAHHPSRNKPNEYENSGQ